MRMKDLHTIIFEAYKAAGQELPLGQLRTQINPKISRAEFIKAIRKCERIYKSQWHEIYDTKLGVVHTKVVEPVVEEPIVRALDPLEALRRAREKREEHE